MNKNASKRYDKEFKRGAVKLITEQGKSVAEAARDLGVSTHSLYAWMAQFSVDGQDAFPGSGKLKPADDELRILRQENRILRMERDLLKKTLPLFMELQK